MAATASEQHIFALERPDASLWTLYLIRAVLSGPFVVVTLPLFFFRYRTLRYRFDEEGIHMRVGVLFRREVNLTYARIQDIHLQSGVIQRWLGLADIQIQTASGSASAELVIEGFKEFEIIRDFLYARMRGTKDGPAAQPASIRLARRAPPLTPRRSPCCSASATSCAARASCSNTATPALRLRRFRPMYKAFRNWTERVLRIAPDPQPPPGDETSTYRFLAAPNYYLYLLVQWVLRTIIALAVIVPMEIIPMISSATRALDRSIPQAFMFRAPMLIIAVVILQRLFALALVRLDFEKRWYLVTNRSLRVREGVVRQREMTITFANIQNISVSQGPIQRLLGIADLRVDTAGGGSQKKEKEGEENLHGVRFAA
jgi:putative membrane protein